MRLFIRPATHRGTCAVSVPPWEGGDSVLLPEFLPVFDQQGNPPFPAESAVR